MNKGLPDEYPAISIGVTTYNRTQMLGECLRSIQNQTFGDFEVIVGNDFPDDRLSGQVLGIEESKFRYLNNPTNLGEVANMNNLLRQARGRYFTWLADDDQYSMHFLEAIHNAIKDSDQPLCVFTAYQTGEAPCAWGPLSGSPPQIYKGRQFLRQYLNRSIETLGCYGVFDTNYLRRLGGIKKLGNGFSPYSDNLLAIQAGLLETVVYIDQPLIFFRSHEGSLSYTSNNLDAYITAQRDLLEEAKPILTHSSLRRDFLLNVSALLLWFIGHIVGVIRRSRLLPERCQVRDYWTWLRKQTRPMRGSPYYTRLIFRSVEIIARVLWAEVRS